jgi:hypothetical protein
MLTAKVIQRTIISDSKHDMFEIVLVAFVNTTEDLTRASIRIVGERILSLMIEHFICRNKPILVHGN